MANATILLVDDEEKVLSSLSRSLSEEDGFEILTAPTAADALEILKDRPGIMVIVSDYHMPGMNGVDFLARAHENYPDTSRILLTGVADLELAINAVNRGSVFRFLVKPCPSDVFLSAIKDGIRYNQLLAGERELLSKTLNGSIKVMVDILSVQNPLIFAQASRLRKFAHELGWALQLNEVLWEVELAALLSQIGAVTVPSNILKRWQAGVTLKDDETEMVRSIPRMGALLIKNIPRLERISEGVLYQHCTYGKPLDANSPTGDQIPLISRILKIVLDFDLVQENTLGTVAAIKAMSSRKNEYDPRILEIFRSKVLRVDDMFTSTGIKTNIGERQIFVDDLKSGMVLTRDIKDKHGALIVSRGTTVTDVLRYKLGNYFRSQAIITPIFIESIF